LKVAVLWVAKHGSKHIHKQLQIREEARHKAHKMAAGAREAAYLEVFGPFCKVLCQIPNYRVEDSVKSYHQSIKLFSEVKNSEIKGSEQ
jgi:phage FluMu protein Com